MRNHHLGMSFPVKTQRPTSKQQPVPPMPVEDGGAPTAGRPGRAPAGFSAHARRLLEAADHTRGCIPWPRLRASPPSRHYLPRATCL